ncbi:MAG TPA: methionine--tRNA ligase [Stellaceae bacterium]
MAGGEKFYVTTPIYYVNDAPHLGHAYTTVACDALTRFRRLDGAEVLFTTGTDEHGQKVENSAQAAGVAPQAFCDRVSQTFRAMNALLGIDTHDFVRTTEQRHIDCATELWNRIAANGAGDIYLGKYGYWYSVRDEAPYDESELVNGKAPTGADVEWVEEENYFFRLSAWQDRLLAFYEANPDFIGPTARRNEVMSFVKGGLRDLSISRTSFTWGIPVPGDAKHIMYVWIEALSVYLTGAGFPDTASARYQKFWPCDLHMVGKDIIRFHCVYWPAFLMAAGLPVPKRVFGHGWWTVEGQKMSKSLGNFIPPKVLVDTYGLDPSRYFMLRELPFGADGDFSHRAMVSRINGDLANDLGNLAQRVLTMVQRYCEGRVPAPGPFTAPDQALLGAARALLAALRVEYAVPAYHRALEQIWVVVGDANRYVDEQAPWALRKSEPARCDTVLYVLADTIRHLAILVQPMMPGSMTKLLDQLAVPPDRRDFAALAASPLVAGTMLPKPKGIFPRYVEEGIDAGR